MIITLTGADFSQNNIGALNSWRIVRALQGVSTNSAITSVAKGGTYTATFTINSGYTLSSWSITMGGVAVTSGVTWKDKDNGTLATTDAEFLSKVRTAEVNITNVSGNIYISMIATANAPTVTYYTFSITPSPSTAKVVINGSEVTSVSVTAGTNVTWSVSASGYDTQSGNYTVNSNYNMTVTLNKQGATKLTTPSITLKEVT
jgi:hypothetical protein